MADMGAFSLWNIKSEPNDISNITDNIKVEKNFNEDTKFVFHLQYNEEADVRQETETKGLIKQEEIQIKDEIPVIHNILHNNDQDVEQNKKIVHLQQSHRSKNLLSASGVSKEKPFECNLCEFKASRKQHLNSHVRTHTGEQPFACNICEFKTSRKYCLKLHIRTHTGEQPFACNICEFKTSRKYYLKLHIRTHAGEKPFACYSCGFKAFSKSSLIKHVKIHAGV